MQELHQHAVSSMSPVCSEPFVQEFWANGLTGKGICKVPLSLLNSHLKEELSHVTTKCS